MLKPTRTFLWAYPALFLALAVGALVAALKELIQGTPPDAVGWWFPGGFAALLTGIAVLFRMPSIRVDDATIVFRPVLFRNGTFDRREVAAIVGTGSSLSSRVSLLRSDGSILFTTSGTMWGRTGIQSLADFLRVPLQGAEYIPSYWDFGRRS